MDLILYRLYCRRTHLAGQPSTYLYWSELLDGKPYLRRRCSAHHRHHGRTLRDSICLLVFLHYHSCSRSWRAQDVVYPQLVGLHLSERWFDTRDHTSWQSPQQQRTEWNCQCFDDFTGDYVAFHGSVLCSRPVSWRDHVAWKGRGQEHGENCLGLAE